MNGTFSKEGTFYEEDYVLFECLRMLTGEVEEVQWEGKLLDGHGIDCWIRERGRRVAIQCKTRSTNPWTASALKKPLEWARFQLERTDVDAPVEYRFVTNASLPRGWRESVGLPPSLSSRIDCQIIDEQSLEMFCDSMARLVAEGHALALIERIRRLARDSLERRITPQTMHDAVIDAGIELHGKAGHVGFGETLRNLRDRFESDLAASRRPLEERVPRPESSAIVELLRSDGGPRQILVHAQGGYGKSEILGAVVQELTEQGIATLVVRADSIEDLIEVYGIPKNPITSLRNFVGTAKAVIVIDQLDRVAHAGASAQRALLRIKDWLLQARSQFDVVIGCRALDAKHDSQIGEIVDPAAAEVSVGLFPESIAQAQLATRGIPFADLGSDVQRMARIPIFLRCILDLAMKEPAGAWRTARSTRDLVLKWWRAVLEPIGVDATTVVDRVVDVMERTGAPDVERTSLAPLPDATIDACVRAGILVEQRGRVSLAHQVFNDMWIARRWEKSSSAGELLERLGPPRVQDLHKARQLRLTTPLLRMETGARILDGLMRSGEVRAHLKQALCLGLAEIDNIDPSIVDVVMSWLEDPAAFDRVLATVITGQEAWFDALAHRGWFDAAWTPNSPADRPREDALLGVLRGVVRTRGNEVAAYLRDWSRIDPELRERANYVFWQDPAADSDEFFELRLAAPDAALDRGWIDWRILVRVNPRRALRLLDRTLSFVRPASLLESRRQHAASTWPHISAVPQEFIHLGLEAWVTLGPWWRGLEVDELWRVPVDDHTTDLLKNVAETLARCLAHALSTRTIDWKSLVAQMPNPQRRLDEWLLLEIGAEGSTFDTDVADQAVDWFIANPDAALIRVGRRQLAEEHYELAGKFVAAVSSRCSAKALRRLETFLIRHPGTWTADHERWRASEGNFAWPGEAGLVAHRLLQSIPEERWSAEARGRMGTLSRKFDSRYGRREPAFVMTSGDSSSIPEDVADRWTTARWLEEFGRAPTSRKGSWRDSKVHTMETLLDLLARLAVKDPARYLEHVRHFTDPERRVDPRIVARLLHTLHSARSGDAASQERFAIDTSELVPIVSRILDDDEPAIHVVIGEIVRDRAEYSWGHAVVDSVAANAASGSPISLSALAAIAAKHPERREQVLSIANSVATHSDPSVRALAVRAAASCHDSLGDRALAVAVDAAWKISGGAAYDVVHTLCFTAAVAKTPALRKRAVGRLMEFAHDPDREAARAGGPGLMQLRIWDRIDDQRVREALGGGGSDAFVVARSAAAEFVAQWMAGHLPDPRSSEWAIEFANDSEPTVSHPIFLALRREGGERWMDDAAFVKRILETRGATLPGNQSHLLTALDRRGSLLPVADHVIALARSIATARSARVDTSNDWESERAGVEVIARLHRLIEECEQRHDFDRRAEALDVLDELLDAGVSGARDSVDIRTR
jgi:hypothetical protein